MDSFKKYLKYKEKYLNLKSQIGGMKHSQMGGPGGKSWAKSTSSAPSKPVVPRDSCEDDDEKRVINCKLILEDEHGNRFMGANGTNITSGINEKGLPKAFVGLTNNKSIQKVLDDIYNRVGRNDKIVLPPTELAKFKKETFYDESSTIDKIIGDNDRDPISVHAGYEIYPGGGGGGGGSRVITRDIKEREQFVRARVINEFPIEYNYVIENGLKLKIIQPPLSKTFFNSYLGGARDGVQKGSPNDCLNMHWKETTDNCLRREVLEEANVDLAALCLNWAITPKPDRPPIAVPDFLYFDHYETDGNNCCTKYYYLKISDTLKPHFLSAYNMIRVERATEFFNGEFRPKAGGTTGSSSGGHTLPPSGGATSGP
jgi:hypothetical protein